MMWLMITIFMMFIWFGVVGWGMTNRQVDTSQMAEGMAKERAIAANLDRVRLRRISTIAAAVLPVVWLLITVFSAWTTVDVGKVGVVKTFGHLDGHLDPGVHFVKPWSDVINFDTRVKTLHFSGEDGQLPAIAAFSSETQNAQVRVTLNINVASKDVDTLYRQIGSDYTQLIPSRVNQVVKDETVKYTAVDLAPNREKLRAAVRERLRTELAPFSINVLDVNIDNISFSPQFEKAIEDKQEATQAALRSQQLVQQAKFEAQSKVEQAKGAAEVLRQTAAGQADANRDLNASLSPEILQYLTIQKLADNVQVMMIPATGNTLFNLPGLKTTP